MVIFIKYLAKIEYIHTTFWNNYEKILADYQLLLCVKDDVLIDGLFLHFTMNRAQSFKICQ